MDKLAMNNAALFAASLLLSFTSAAVAETVNDPCRGPSMLLSIVNRPTVSDSACAVPYKSVVVEAGYQYTLLTHSLGHLQSFPQGSLRIGLPYRSEFVVVAGNYLHFPNALHNGFTATTVGIKHELGYNAKWLGTAELLITMPNGSALFGSKGTGAALNGIVNYTITPAMVFSFMGGVTSLTLPSQFGGTRYTSFNPDGVLSYSLTDRLNAYIEVYGATQTAPGAGSGFNSNGGFLYLLTRNISIDVEAGRRIYGDLSGIGQYIAGGFAVLV
jgi:hypothetical protein